METAVIHLIILGVVTGLTKGVGVLPDGPLNAAVGGTVMFNTTLTPPEKPFVSVVWEFIDLNMIKKNIFNDVNLTDPEYEGRITLFTSTASLELRNLTLSDRGEYIVFITSQEKGQMEMDGSTRLEVYDGPENINLTISPTQEYFEEGSNITLSCSADSRPSAQFTWLLNGDRLSDTGPELRLVNIQMSHSGNYSCHAFNKETLRHQTSQPSVVSVLVVKTSPCSSGCIAGIVIACLVVCGAGVGGYYIFQKTINNKPQAHDTEREENMYENTSEVYDKI